LIAWCPLSSFVVGRHPHSNEYLVGSLLVAATCVFPPPMIFPLPFRYFERYPQSLLIFFGALFNTTALFCLAVLFQTLGFSRPYQTLCGHLWFRAVRLSFLLDLLFSYVMIDDLSSLRVCGPLWPFFFVGTLLRRFFCFSTL